MGKLAKVLGVRFFDEYFDGSRVERAIAEAD
jgi:hypothetical protein